MHGLNMKKWTQMFVDVLLSGVSAEVESYILVCQRKWNHTLKLKKSVCID
jgi:hypothetical protein